VWSERLKKRGVTLVHVVSSVKFAKKAQEAGVDAVVAEGFEAGGHNGREETTTMVLVPLVRDAVSIPVIAAGGIADGRGMLAAMALGADGVQVGTRFASSVESSAHDDYKNKIVSAHEGETILTLKQLTPVRMIKNNFYRQVDEAEKRGASPEELHSLLGSRRSKKGIFEGDLDEGELETGQVSAAIRRIETADAILKDIWEEFLKLKKSMCYGVSPD
jgi:enoyl-[acyl-carrier protein] reductase II